MNDKGTTITQNTGGSGSRSRYNVEYVSLNGVTNPQEHLQRVLDAADGLEWHLVGVAGGLPDGGMFLFWDTTRPSFGRSSGPRV